MRDRSASMTWVVLPSEEHSQWDFVTNSTGVAQGIRLPHQVQTMVSFSIVNVALSDFAHAQSRPSIRSLPMTATRLSLIHISEPTRPY